MKKTILITGSTDGIGRAAAETLASAGHRVLLHGRNQAKLDGVLEALRSTAGPSDVDGYVADLSELSAVRRLAAHVAAANEHIDVLINNAGVFNTARPRTADGLDLRFVVNTVAPYVLAKCLRPQMGETSRVINLSSAAQAPVDLSALAGGVPLADGAAYAQSKLALTMWSRVMGEARGADGPIVVAVNPGSMLGTKMVKDAFGVSGGDISVGAKILERAALDDAFAEASGQYFDNDAGRFAPPHPDALNDVKVAAVMDGIESVVTRLSVQA